MVDVLQIDHDVGVRCRVAQRVVEEFGDDDGDRLDGVGHQGGARLQVVVNLDPVVAREPGLAAGDGVHHVGLLAGQSHPGPAHHGRDLRPPQRLLVLVVQREQRLGQLRFVVTLLKPPQGVLQPVKGGLDLPGGTPETGLRGRVDPGALCRQLLAQRREHVLQRDPGGSPGCVLPGGSGHPQVRVGELGAARVSGGPRDARPR